MTSTKHGASALALIAGAALGLATGGASHCQPAKPREVDLNVRGGKDHFWKVMGTGDGFAAVRIQKGEARPPYFHNFRATAGRMWVSGRCMAYDPEGRSKDVLARTDDRGEDTKWDKVGDLSGTRLRVPKGPLKGWWVGLGPPQDGKAGQRARAKLVLVKDKEDAAVFYWGDPYDEGP